MQFLEKDLETIIFETPNEVLQERGLDINGIKKRQLRIGNYGIADLVTCERVWDYDLDTMVMQITVYELKQNNLGPEAFIQALGYAKGIKNYLKSRGIYPNFKIVILGKIKPNGNLLYLTDFYNDMSLYTYEYNIDGLTFKHHTGYALVNEGF